MKGHHLVKMNLVQNIVVIGSQDSNPSKLKTKLEPIKLSQDMGLAVTSFSYGELLNIYEGNNKIYIKIVQEKEINDESGSITDEDIHILEIPTGRYKTSLLIIREIEIVIENHVHFKGSRSLITIRLISKNNKVNISTSGVDLLVTQKNDTPWSLLGLSKDIKNNSEVELENRNLFSGIETAFLYVNIVENSYINGRLSRNLCVLPLYYNEGCHFYEFKNPTYAPVEVKEFSDVILEIRNMRGDLVAFNSTGATIISLHLKPINRID